MDFNYQEHIPKSFSPSSKVWIYQANRLFTVSEAFDLEDMLTAFTKKWNSHGNAVHGFANLFFGKFIVFMADETATMVSGCSIDSSVDLVRQVEKNFGVEMFDRQLLNFLIKDKLEQIPLSQFDYAMNNGLVSPQTLYFNNTVLNKTQWENEWIIPVEKSWLNKKIKV